MENRVTNSQLEELLDFLTAHPSLAKSISLGPRSRETADNQWEEIAFKLNSHSTGASKPGQRWKRYWADLKHKAKTRAAIRRRNAVASGEPSTEEVSEIDRRILSIIGPGAVEDNTPDSADPLRIKRSLFKRASFKANADPPLSELKYRTRQQDSEERNTIDASWVIELESKRVETESKMADAALMLAEAAQAQADAARVQADAAKLQAEAIQAQSQALLDLMTFLTNK